MENQAGSRTFFRGDTALLLAMALVTFALELAFITQYGYFRDELYYIACGNHLAWGYVDQPPFSALVIFLVTHTLGDSLFAIRLLPAICGGLLVLLTGLTAREFGAGRFGQALAAVAVMVGPIFLTINHFYSMNCFDQVFWVLSIYLLTRLLKEDRPRLWVLFGLVAGAGLMNKYSMGFLGLGVIVGLALTPARKYFRSKWLWMGGGLATLIFLPHVIWEIRYGFPTAEFIHNATLYKNLPMSPPRFLLETTLMLLPLTVPLWLAGLYFFFFTKQGKPFRPLGWIFVTFLLVLLSTNSKPYYFTPAFPMLYAGGAVLFESFVRRRIWSWLKPAYVAMLVLVGLIFLPYSVPVLPVDTFIRYEDFIGLHPGNGERGAPEKLPQVYGDMFGWQNMVATVAQVYNSLTPEERARTLLFCSNYGEAGAIDLFGAKYGLPKASSGHNTYWYWGPANPSAGIVITVGESKEDVEKAFRDVQVAAVAISTHARAFEADLPIYVGRDPKLPLARLWPRTKHFM